MNGPIPLIDTLDRVQHLIARFNGSYIPILIEPHKFGQQPNQFLRVFYSPAEQAFINVALNVPPSQGNLIGTVVLGEVTKVHRNPTKNVTMIFVNFVSTLAQQPPLHRITDGRSMPQAVYMEGARVVLPFVLAGGGPQYLCILDDVLPRVEFVIERAPPNLFNNTVQVSVDTISGAMDVITIHTTFVKIADPVPQNGAVRGARNGWPPLLQAHQPAGQFLPQPHPAQQQLQHQGQPAQFFAAAQPAPVPVPPRAAVPAIPPRAAAAPAAAAPAAAPAAVGPGTPSDSMVAMHGLDADTVRMLWREGITEDSQVQQFAWHKEFVKMGYTPKKLQAAYPKVYAFWERITNVIRSDPVGCQGRPCPQQRCAEAFAPLS
jgi:hypothetical protein